MSALLYHIIRKMQLIFSRKKNHIHYLYIAVPPLLFPMSEGLKCALGWYILNVKS